MSDKKMLVFGVAFFVLGAAGVVVAYYLSGVDCWHRCPKACEMFCASILVGCTASAFGSMMAID